MTLDDVLWIDLTWKQTVARCFMYANTWYEGRDAIVSMRFLYYAIPRPVKKFDRRCWPVYRNNSFPLAIELLAPAMSCVYGIGSEEYYALFELLSRRFGRIKRLHDYSCRSLRRFLQDLPAPEISPEDGPTTLYHYDYTLVSSILELTKEKRISWIKKEFSKYDAYVGSFAAANGKKTTIEIKSIWPETVDPIGRDPCLYKIRAGSFTRLFFQGTKIGSLVDEIICNLENSDPEVYGAISEYLQQFVSNDIRNDSAMLKRFKRLEETFLSFDDVANNSTMLYQYDYKLVSALLALTRENRIHWVVDHTREAIDDYFGILDTDDGKRIIVKLNRIWIEAENQCGRDPYFFKITTGSYRRFFFIGTILGSLVYEIVSYVFRLEGEEAHHIAVQGSTFAKKVRKMLKAYSEIIQG